jgi:hypothetical protein
MAPLTTRHVTKHVGTNWKSFQLVRYSVEKSNLNSGACLNLPGALKSWTCTCSHREDVVFITCSNVLDDPTDACSHSIINILGCTLGLLLCCYVIDDWWKCLTEAHGNVNTNRRVYRPMIVASYMRCIHIKWLFRANVGCKKTRLFRDFYMYENQFCKLQVINQSFASRWVTRCLSSTSLSETSFVCLSVCLWRRNTAA